MATKESIVLKAQAALDAAKAFAAEPAPTAPITYLGSYPTPSLPELNRRMNFGKHTKMAYCPDTTLIYLVGGDGTGHHFSSFNSGSMDTVGVYDTTTHVYTEDFLYKGYAGEPTPRGADFVGFTWIPTLKEFWLGPGYFWNYTSAIYPWEDYSFTGNNYASYSPTTKHFKDRGAKVGYPTYLPGENFGGSWDSKRNRLLFPFSQGISVVDISNGNQLTRINLNITSHPINKSPSWYDSDTDELYFTQFVLGKVYAYKFDTKVLRVVTDKLLPAPMTQSEATRAMCFITDKKHLLIVYTAFDMGGDLNSWKLIDLTSGVITSFNGYAPGCDYHSAAEYNPSTKRVVIIGGDGTNGSAFHEYSVDIATPTPVPPPDPPPPPSPTDPALWLPAVGSVKAISGPGTDAPNVVANVMYLTAAGSGSGAGGNYFGNWCSGVYSEDDGTLGSLVTCSGGDGDYWGNEVYKFLFDNRAWSRECERSTGLLGSTSGNPPDPNFDSTWGEHKSPSGTPPPQPGVPHDYDQVEYLPAALGGGPKGSFIFCTRTIVYRYQQSRHPHLFDLDLKAWRRGSATPNLIAWEGTEPPSSPTWCLDRTRNRYWGLKDGGVYITRLNWMSFGVNGYVNSVGGTPIPQFLVPKRYPTSRHWPTGDLLLVAGMNPSLTGFSLYACPLATPATGFKLLSLSGNNIPPGAGYGFVHCPDLDCFFVRAADGSRQVIWKITPPTANYLTGTWAVTQITMLGDTVAAKGNVQGMWKRFVYATKVKCLSWVDDINGPVYAYRVI
jgi:hypothetical protein